MQEKIDSILQKYSYANRDSLIPILQEIQEEVRYLTEEALISIGKHLNLPTSKIYGLATFYNQFRFESKGKYHIQVCHGTACHLVGSVSLIEYLQKLLKINVNQKTRDGKFSLEVVTCMGACAQAPVIVINGDYYKELSSESIRSLIQELIERDE